jgi:hypothetical protein
VTGSDWILIFRYLGYYFEVIHSPLLSSTHNRSKQLKSLHHEMPRYTLFLLIASSCYLSTNAFTLEMMGGRRGKGNLKRSLDDSSAVGDKRVKVASSGVASL